MKKAAKWISYFGLVLFAICTLSAGCDRTSSPEGRMSIQVEALQQQLDSLNQQNQAIRDSLGSIRRELEEIKNSR